MSQSDSGISIDSLTMTPFDARTVSEEFLISHLELAQITSQERSPDDPPLKVEPFVAGFRNIPSFVEVTFWSVALPDGNVVALGDFGILLTEENQHLGQFTISVHPEWRRKGIGRLLLTKIVEKAEEKNRRILITGATNRVPGADPFLKRFGAKIVLEAHVNQLRMSKLDPNLVDSWAKLNPEGFEIGWWGGIYPEEEIDNILALQQLMNQVPHGDMELDDFRFTKEQVRDEEKGMEARGQVRWSVYVREKATGKFAGYSELFRDIHRPAYAYQGITAVWPEYRGHGLGRWLKASMLDRLRREHPEVEFIRTSNADSNAPMLKINTELGFTPYRDDLNYQMETSKVRELLG